MQVFVVEGAGIRKTRIFLFLINLEAQHFQYPLMRPTCSEPYLSFFLYRS